MRAALLCVVALCAVFPAQQHSPAEEWKRCSACHTVPDKLVAGDVLWAGRLATTACIQPAAPKSTALRTTLKEWLLTAERQRARRIDSEVAPLQDEGLVNAAFSEGSVLLVNPAAEDKAATALRLVWSKGATGTRAVPAGTWQVAAYRVQRRDKDLVEWQLWAAGGSGRKFVVEAGKPLKLELAEHLTTTLNWKRAGQNLQVGVGVTADSGMGATVVRAGERVPARYVLRNKAETALAGDLNYG